MACQDHRTEQPWVEAGAVPSGAGQAVVGVDALGRDPEPLEGGLLGGEVLPVGRAAGVADRDRGHGGRARTLGVPSAAKSSYHVTETGGTVTRAAAPGPGPDRPLAGPLADGAGSRRREAAMTLERRTASLAGRGEEGQARAMARFAVLRPHLEEGVPLARAAGEAGVPPRTAQRWLARYRRDGLAGLARPVRSDAGAHRAPPEPVALVEGSGLKRPPASAPARPPRAPGVAPAGGRRAPPPRTGP